METETKTNTTAESEFPKVETLEDGSTKTTQENGTWEKVYPDGKRIVYRDDLEIELTIHTDGSREFILPQSKKKCTIKEAYGDDVIQARRLIGQNVNEESFVKSCMSQLIRIDGEFIGIDEWGKIFKMKDYLIIEGNFKELNF